MSTAWALSRRLNSGLRTFDSPLRRIFHEKSADRADLPADLLRFALFPVQAEGLLIPVLGFLLEGELVFVRAIHVVEGHAPSPCCEYGSNLVPALLRRGFPAMGRQGVAKRWGHRPWGGEGGGGA